MTTLVVDASVIVETLMPGGLAAREWLLEQLADDELWVIQGLTRLEVSSALRAIARRYPSEADWVERAHGRLTEFPALERPVGQGMLRRVWELRGNLSAYDAAYVALAEELQGASGGRAALVTADRKIVNSGRATCSVLVYERPRN